MQILIGQAFQNPFFWIVVVFLAHLAYKKGGAYLKDRREQEAARLAAQSEMTLALSGFTETMASIEATVAEFKASQEKAMAGTVKACAAIAIATDKHRESVAELGKMFFGSDPGREALQNATEEYKDKTYRKMEHRAAGKTEEEAEALAEVEIEQDALSTYPSE